MVDVVQLVRASDCGSECRRFESDPPPQRVSEMRLFFRGGDIGVANYFKSSPTLHPEKKKDIALRLCFFPFGVEGRTRFIVIGFADVASTKKEPHF